MHPPLEFGDYVVSINDEVLEDKIHFYQIIKELARKKKHQMVTLLELEFRIEHFAWILRDICALRAWICLP